MNDLDAIRWVGICGNGFAFDADVDKLFQQCMEEFAGNFEDRGLGVFHGANVGDTRGTRNTANKLNAVKYTFLSIGWPREVGYGKSRNTLEISCRLSVVCSRVLRINRFYFAANIGV